MRYIVILLLVFVADLGLMAQVDKTTPRERPETIDRTTDEPTTRNKRDRKAQVKNKTTQALEINRPELTIKWSPSPLISFTAPTLQFSVEYPIGKSTEHFYLEHDVGYVYSDPNFTVANAGFRFGTRFKYYFRPVTSHFNNFFVSVMARHTQRHEKGRTFFERGGGAFLQQFEYSKVNNYSSGYLELGYISRFGQDERMTFEILAGAGLHYVTDTIKGIPDDAEIQDFNDAIFSIPRETVLPTVILVIKFGYIFKTS